MLKIKTIQHYGEVIKINILRLVIIIFFRKNSRPIVYKYLEMKDNMITPQEFEGWILSDAQGL